MTISSTPPPPPKSPQAQELQKSPGGIGLTFLPKLLLVIMNFRTEPWMKNNIISNEKLQGSLSLQIWACIWDFVLHFCRSHCQEELRLGCCKAAVDVNLVSGAVTMWLRSCIYLPTMRHANELLCPQLFRKLLFLKPGMSHPEHMV